MESWKIGLFAFLALAVSGGLVTSLMAVHAFIRGVDHADGEGEMGTKLLNRGKSSADFPFPDGRDDVTSG